MIGESSSISVGIVIVYFLSCCYCCSDGGGGDCFERNDGNVSSICVPSRERRCLSLYHCERVVLVTRVSTVVYLVALASGRHMSGRRAGLPATTLLVIRMNIYITRAMMAPSV